MIPGPKLCKIIDNSSFNLKNVKTVIIIQYNDL